MSEAIWGDQERANRPVVLVDYDDIATWAPWFATVVGAIAQPELFPRLRSSTFELLDDAGDYAAEAIDLEQLHHQILAADTRVRVWHGTRLTEATETEIRRHGLRPLDALSRKDALVQIFQIHPLWHEVEDQLPSLLHRLGPGNEVGVRQDGGVHTSLSRGGLLQGCPHYLVWGSELDVSVAERLFSDGSGLALLSAARRPFLISFDVTLSEVVAATDRYPLADGEMPSFIRRLLNAWAFYETDKSFSPAQLRACDPAVFFGAVSADRLRFEAVADADIAEP